jgi:hypothetical protein
VEALLYLAGGFLVVLGIGWFVESEALWGPASARAEISRRLKRSNDLIDSIRGKP